MSHAFSSHFVNFLSVDLGVSQDAVRGSIDRYFGNQNVMVAPLSNYPGLLYVENYSDRQDAVLGKETYKCRNKFVELAGKFNNGLRFNVTGGTRNAGWLFWKKTQDGRPNGRLQDLRSHLTSSGISVKFITKADLESGKLDGYPKLDNHTSSHALHTSPQVPQLSNTTQDKKSEDEDKQEDEPEDQQNETKDEEDEETPPKTKSKKAAPAKKKAPAKSKKAAPANDESEDEAPPAEENSDDEEEKPVKKVVKKTAIKKKAAPAKKKAPAKGKKTAAKNDDEEYNLDLSD